MMVGAALIWDIYMPMNKALWSSSFVLYSSGLGGMMLMVLVYFIDIKGFKGGLKPVEAYGINALFSYILHYLTTGYLLATPLGIGVFDYLSGIIPPANAMLVTMLIILTVTWIPLGLLQAKKIIIKV
jgi:predicted acyltransferase